MGTRGLFGFYYKNKYYMVYNHMDSYPDYLGKMLVAEIVNAIKNNTFNGWLTKLLSLKIISESNPPTPTDDDVLKLVGYTELRVSTQSNLDWYCLLRGCQGSYLAVLDSGYLLQNSDEPCCDLYIEYCYVVNFDNDTFDFYNHGRMKSVSLKDLTDDYFKEKVHPV
jgi:hypothetical protein